MSLENKEHKILTKVAYSTFYFLTHETAQKQWDSVFSYVLLIKDLKVFNKGIIKCPLMATQRI